MRDSVKSLLQVEEGHMDGLGASPAAPAAFFDEATLVGRYCDNFSQLGIDEPLEYRSKV